MFVSMVAPVPLVTPAWVVKAEKTIGVEPVPADTFVRLPLAAGAATGFASGAWTSGLPRLAARPRALTFELTWTQRRDHTDY